METSQMLEALQESFLSDLGENMDDYLRFLQTAPPELQEKALELVVRDLAKLKQENERLRQPPLSPGVVLDQAVSGNGAGELAIVKTLPDGRMMACTRPDELREQLVPGSAVLLNQSGMILSVLGFHRGHQIGKIASCRPERHEVTVVDSLAGQAETVLLLSEELRMDPGVRVGARVLYDPHLLIATGLEAPAADHSQDILRQLPSNLSWANLILQPEVKEEVLDLLDDILAAVEHEGEQLCVMRVVDGPPGCGKTMLAQTLAVELSRRVTPDKMAWKFVNGVEFVSSMLAEGETRIRALFAECRQNASENRTTVLAWDEIESCFPRRHEHSNLWPDTLVTTILHELSGFQPLSQIVFLALTNRADLLDPALLRAGRLLPKLHIPRPGWAETQQLFQLYLGKVRSKLQEPIGEMADRAAAYVWAPASSEEHPLAVVRFVDGTKEKVPMSALASGDLARGAVDEADRRARRRKRHGAEGVLCFGDLRRGIDRCLDVPMSPQNLSGLLDWDMAKCRQVESITRPGGDA